MTSERILLVDDEENARGALRTLLGDEGYQIREAKDGEEALAQLAGFAPAVVLSDVRMPGMDGLTFLKKAKEQGSDASFFMMTAYANVESAVEAMQAGAENYLVKPLALDTLLVFIDRAMAKRRLQRDAQIFPLRDLERDAILRALALVGGSTHRAAELLGISVRKVQYRLKEYRRVTQGVDAEAAAPPPVPIVSA